MSPVVSIAQDDKEFTTTFARNKIVLLLDVLNALAASTSEMVVTFKKSGDDVEPYNVVVNAIGRNIKDNVHMTTTLLEDGKAVHVPVKEISQQLRAEIYNDFTISHDGIYYNDVKALAIDLIAATSRAYVSDTDESDNAKKLIKLVRGEKDAVIEAGKAYGITVANVFTSIDTKLINVIRAANAISKCDRQLSSINQNVMYNSSSTTTNNYSREVFNDYILGEITADFAVSKIALNHRIKSAERLEQLQKRATEDKKRGDVPAWRCNDFNYIEEDGLIIQNLLDMLVFNGVEYDGRIFTTQVGRIKLNIPVNATSHWSNQGFRAGIQQL